MKLWIARDTSGDLYFHKEKPFLSGKKSGWWFSSSFIKLDNDECAEVTFENSPQEVELVLKK